MKKVCSVRDCLKPVHGRGYCHTHAKASREGRDFSTLRKSYRTPEESFAARTNESNGCLIWKGAKNSRGYGKIVIKDSSGKNKTMYAHRYAWVRVNGKIPEGMQVDHLCHNRACVKVEHLRLATNTTNHQNLKGARSDSKSGVRGAIWSSSKKKFIAQVWLNGKRIYLGSYETAEEAGKAAETKRNELFSVPGGA